MIRRNFYDVTPECLAKLNGEWCVSWSGGKDSTAVVTLIEYLRRTGQCDVARPQLVQCDTSIEDHHLQVVAAELANVLRASGWECAIVKPKINEKLYNRILGIGNTPVHPGGGRFMRWCTRSTKIDPMDRWRREHSSGLVLTGLRLGESSVRDAKLAKRGIGCSAGGECGVPAATENTFSPIIHWTMCNVIDWLQLADGESTMSDTLSITRKLAELYEVSVGQDGLWDDVDREVSAARFGCIGCPAISSDRLPPRSVARRNGESSPLNEIYDVWFEARRRDNRLINPKTGGRGPIRMHVRKLLFERVMDIQRRSGVVLITPEDEAFIRECWAKNVYPRGWSLEMESIEAVSYRTLFDGVPGQ